MFPLTNTANIGGALSGENHCRVVCPDDTVAVGILDFFCRVFWLGMMVPSYSWHPLASCELFVSDAGNQRIKYHSSAQLSHRAFLSTRGTQRFYFSFLLLHLFTHSCAATRRGLKSASGRGVWSQTRFTPQAKCGCNFPAWKWCCHPSWLETCPDSECTELLQVGRDFGKEILIDLSSPLFILHIPNPVPFE